ncbi:MAG: glutamine--fructose-6-phosphate transaminase (isomerizing) [Oscillospiraceae bacterium]
MCGIVGYVGEKECTEVLLDALDKLKYRGYDSAGISIFENDTIQTIKSKGMLTELEAKVASSGLRPSHCGIGHTRWATHGEPSDINSHPHGNARISIVHNGIIENYKKLKAFLEGKGYVFESQTDTETVAKLLDFYYNGNPKETIRKALADIEGSYALGIMFSDFPTTIFAVRKDSPLIVGIGKEEAYIASDVPAILKYTREYLMLDVNEIAEISASLVNIFDQHGDPVTKDLQIATWDMEAAEKGGYEHYMLKEIHEQPESIRRTITPRISDGLPNLEECGITPEKLRSYNNIFIVACGTAMHAGLVAKYVIEKLARVSVTVDVASEFRYRNPILSDKDLVILVSQSGTTADTLEALRLSKRIGATTLSIVNVKGSTIAQESDMVIYTHAGPEISVASTKAYMVQIATFYLLAFELAYAKGRIDEAELRRLTSLLCAIPQKIEEILSAPDKCQYVASTLVNAENLLYIGRGLDYALSMEGSLKLKEISYIHSESYAAGELKHGTISLVTAIMPVIAVATQHDVFDKTMSNVEEVITRGAKVTLITHEGISCDIAEHVIHLPTTDDILMPMVTVVPLQLIAYYTSVLRGNSVDTPRNLAKSVTVE